MKTVVITGSGRGFGFEMAKLFRQKNCHVVLCDIDQESLKKAEKELTSFSSKGRVLSFLVDVTKEETISNMIKGVLKEFKEIDIWINNAGVNQPNKPIWEIKEEEIDRLLAIDLKGTILCSKLIVPVMKEQGKGQIYNVEGHGSNDAKILGLSIYGTSKRAVTYFTESLAYEIEKCQLPIQVGKITPGIMITNFIHTALGNGEEIELDESTKKVYNILGDYPETIAAFMVDKILTNTKNNVKFTWLTNRKAAFRFMTSKWNHRDFFAQEKK